MSKTKSVAMILTLALVCLVQTGSAESRTTSGHWVSAWGAAVQAPIQFSSAPPSQTFENETIRMIVRSTIGGQRIRVRLSNEFGTTPLVIGAVHVALTEEGAMIVPESDHPLTFGGESSVTIPSGAPILSDPTDLLVPAFAEIAVSIFLPDKTPASTIHMLAQHDTYISGPGDFTAKPDIPNATSKASWYWLADVEVWAADQTAAIVTLGDSITDGAGVKPGQYVDWPDRLARRIADDRKAPLMAVINEGIGGNRILHDGAGVSALARFDRDVLSRPGVASLIVLEGINDIGWPNMKPPASQGASQFSVNSFASETVTAKDLILGLQQIINRAHEHGIRVFGATMTPYEKADYFTAEGETIRLAVNQWIRTSGAFDGVLDFDAAVRDPNYTSRFREDYHSGDHPHPNAAGYKAMADAINLLALLGNHK